MSDSIDIGLRTKTFAKQDDFTLYENVELFADSKVSVRAKAVGELLGSFTSWAKVSGANQEIELAENTIRIHSNVATNYGIGVYSSPSNVRYIDVSEKTLHVTADINIGSTGQSNAEVLVGLYLRRNDEFVSHTDGLYYKTIGVYTQSTNHIDFSFVVGGDWFSSNYEDAYLAMRIACKTNTNIDVTISNLHIRADQDTPTTTFTASCPWATPAIARQVLNSLDSFHYRPYQAKGARLNPITELGDNVVIDYTGYGLYSQTAKYSSELVSDISAPFEEEIDHEYPYEKSTERRFKREVRTLRAELSIATDQIDAKVSSVEGSQATFGWTLQKDNFTVYAGGRSVLKVTQSGAEISGRVVATSGTIGGCEIDTNGHLQVGSANIREINADRINAGTLKVQYLEQGKIDSPWLAQGAVTETNLGGLSVSGGKIQGGAVSPVKTSFSGTLGQVGVNQSDIAAIKGYFLNILTVNTLQINGSFYWKLPNKTLNFRPMTYASISNAKYILGSTT